MDDEEDRRARPTVWLIVLLAVIGGGFALWLSPIGSGPRCWLELRDSEIIELPDGGLTLEQYTKEVDTASGGCANIAVRSGPDAPGSIVLGPDGGRFELNTSERDVFVETAAE